MQGFCIYNYFHTNVTYKNSKDMKVRWSFCTANGHIGVVDIATPGSYQRHCKEI